MIAVTERPTTAVSVGTPRPPAGADARALALGYLQYASACWRGDPVAPVFGKRLGAFWRPDLPPAPATVPDALSPHGGGGRGIRWYQTSGEVRGYVPGARGGYQVPVCAIARLTRCAPAGPWAIEHRPERQWRKPGDETRRYERATACGPSALIVEEYHDSRAGDGVCPETDAAAGVPRQEVSTS